MHASSLPKRGYAGRGSTICARLAPESSLAETLRNPRQKAGLIRDGIMGLRRDIPGT